MSSLICYSNEEYAVIATDTLAVDPVGNPLFFTNKATYLPTIKTVICGTGVGGFHSRWAEHVNSGMNLLDVDNLDYHATKLLIEMWDDYKIEFNINSELTVTIYHIGWSLDAGKIKRFAYRSTNNFISEEIQDGWFFKPECVVPDGDDITEVIKNMMHEQRAIQDDLSKEERVYIGGQINIIVLERDCARHLTVGEFPDYHQTLNQIL